MHTSAQLAHERVAIPESSNDASHYADVDEIIVTTTRPWPNRYIGFDVDYNRDGKADPLQLLILRTPSADSHGVLAKTAQGLPYSIHKYITENPGRYLNDDGSLRLDETRQLLQLLVSSGAIKVSQADERPPNFNRPLFDATGASYYPDGLHAEDGPAARTGNRDYDRGLRQGEGFAAQALLELAAVLFPAGELAGAMKLVQTLTRKGALDVAETVALKKAQAVLTAYAVGAGAGGSSYALFIEEKYWDEALQALAAGKPLESLSLGAKAAFQLINWTLAPGSISSSLAQANVNAGKFLMNKTLGQGTLKGFNWGMFIDPKAWTQANVQRVFGAAAGNIETRYASVLGELRQLASTGQSVVKGNGQLNVSEAAIRAAGFENLEGLVASMTKDGFWRAFAIKPVLYSPFVLASANGASGTANSYFQLMASRGLAGVGANLVLQSLNGLGIKGTVSFNWDQAIASITGGGVRSWGAPGAWAGEFGARLISYGASSAAAFFAQMYTKGLLAARGSEPSEEFSKQELQILARANDAVNATLALHSFHVQSGQVPDKALFDSKGGGLAVEYLKRLHALMSTKNPRAIVAAAANLDQWLNQPITASGLTRRARLNMTSIPEEMGKRLETFHLDPTSPKTGTMADMGITPSRFTAQ